MTSIADLVRLTLDVPAVAKPGVPVPITLRVENTRDHAIELTLRGRTIAFDVLVRDSAGQLVWQRLGGAMIPAILRLEPLAAREALELRTEWPASVLSGDFVVEATLFTDGADLRPSPVSVNLGREADDR